MSVKKNNRFSLYELLKTEKAKKVSSGTLKRMVSRFPKVSTKKHKGNAFIYQKVPISANFGRYAFEKVGIKLYLKCFLKRQKETPRRGFKEINILVDKLYNIQLTKSKSSSKT